ncbi:putative type IIS restriction [Anopheles sinensis]|uniref:Putative type IIS restriction n=1 Tax=Anopheles sinensis TaxID=74873 RepID=A0A084W7V6_ANOSI|nr:putative type IIS restriction [Anopheles sinensis]
MHKKELPLPGKFNRRTMMNGVGAKSKVKPTSSSDPELDRSNWNLERAKRNENDKRRDASAANDSHATVFSCRLKMKHQNIQHTCKTTADHQVRPGGSDGLPCKCARET